MPNPRNPIAANDVDIMMDFPEFGIMYQLETATSFNPSVNGTTSPIHRIGNPEPLNPGQGETNYEIGLSMQTSEWETILAAYAAKTIDRPAGPVKHVRDLIGDINVTVIKHKRRDNPAQAHVTTYYGCTGVSQSDPVERSSIETITELTFSARTISNTTVLE